MKKSDQKSKSPPQQQKQTKKHLSMKPSDTNNDELVDQTMDMEEKDASF